MKKRHPTDYGLSFVAYEILNSIVNEIDNIKKLENCFFEIPPTAWTDDLKQIKIWHREWLARKLYEKFFNRWHGCQSQFYQDKATT